MLNASNDDLKTIDQEIKEIQKAAGKGTYLKMNDQVLLWQHLPQSRYLDEISN